MKRGPAPLAAAYIFAALTACSGGGPLTGPQAVAMSTIARARNAELRTAQGFALPRLSHAQPPPGIPMDPAAKTGSHLIYSGNFFSSTITIYPMKGKNPPPIGTIATGLAGPERLFVDAQLNIYATNGEGNSVVVYPPGGTTPSLTISNGVVTPTGLTVGADGTVYCANAGNSTVTEYPKGGTTPSLTVTLSNETPENLAVGPGNNLYVQYVGGPLGSGVIEVAPGSTSGHDLNLQIEQAGAVEVDSAGNVIVADDGTSSVDVFAAGQSTPSQTLSVGGLPFELALPKSQNGLYISTGIGTTFTIQTANYPTLSKLKTKLTTTAGDWPLAIAPDSAQ